VVFTYQPPLLLVGGLLTGAGLLLACLLVLFGARRRPASHRA
jgi:hypothetical protein